MTFSPKSPSPSPSPQPTPSENSDAQASLQPQPIDDIPTWRRWLVVLGAFLALFCTFGQLISFGTYLSWYRHNQLGSYSPSAIAFIGSLQLWVFFFSGGFVGWYFDRYGPRPILLTGSAIYASSLVMISFCQNYYQYLLIQGVFFGLGVGVMFYPSMSSVTTHFSRNRATAIGVAMAGSSTGGIIFPIMLRHLFVQVGFANTVRISALLSLLCCGMAALTITSARPPSPAHGEDYIACLKDGRYRLLIVGSALISLGVFIPPIYISEFVQAQAGGAGSPEGHISIYILAIMNASGLVGRILLSALSDRVGRFNILFLSASLSGVSCMCLWLPTSFVHTTGGRMALEVSFALTFGFFSGGFVALINACIVEISMEEENQIGTRIGLLYHFISFPSMIGGPVAGRLPGSHSHPFIGMILFAGVTITVGSLFIFRARLGLNSRLLASV